MLQITSRNKTFIFDRPAIMGILNVTPDSFSDGGRYNLMDNALQHCEQMISNGADFIDIGGCSTRPNNAIATEQEELERVIPILKAIRKAFPEALISIDTFRKNVAEACMSEGVDLINDISGGLFDAEMLPYIGKNNIPYIMTKTRVQSFFLNTIKKFLCYFFIFFWILFCDTFTEFISEL